MNQMSSERLVLLALQQRPSGLNEFQLGMITMLPQPEVQQCIAKLKASGRIGQLSDAFNAYYIAEGPSNRPFIPGWEHWLKSFCESEKFAIEDTYATTICMCGVVLLTAIAGGTRSPELINRVTTLPLQFVKLVLGMADRLQVWQLDFAFDLERSLSDAADALEHINARFNWLTADFWELCWDPSLEAAFNESRAGHQFGGKVDWWTDIETPAALVTER